MTCKDCLHYAACLEYSSLKDSEFAQNINESDVLCDIFKDKSEYVHLPCKAGTILEPDDYNIEKCVADHWAIVLVTRVEGTRLPYSMTQEEVEKALGKEQG